MPDNSPKVLDMTAAALREAQTHVRGLISAHDREAPLKAIWPRLARKLGVSERRIRAIWHGEARAISSAEMDALRAASRATACHSIKDTIAHVERLESAAAALAAVDPEFYGAQIDSLRDAALRVRGTLPVAWR